MPKSNPLLGRVVPLLERVVSGPGSIPLQGGTTLESNPLLGRVVPLSERVVSGPEIISLLGVVCRE